MASRHGRALFMLMGDDDNPIPWYLNGGIPKDNCIGVYKAIGAESLAASYINLVSPGTNDLTTAAAPSFDAATGWTFNGSTALKFPGAITAGCSMVLRFSDRVGDGIFAGSAIGSVDFCIQQATIRYYDNGTQGSNAETDTSGVVGLSDYGYFNGIVDTTQLTGIGDNAGGAGIGGNCFANGAVSPSLVGKIQAIAFYNILLSAAQMLAVSTQMAALTNP